MEYTNVIITKHVNEKIKEIFGKYFTKNKISLGSLCRKSFSFMTTLSMMYPYSNCIFIIMADKKSYRYECIIGMNGVRLFIIMYNLSGLPDCNNVDMLIRSVFIKQKYLKWLYDEHEAATIIKFKHDKYKTTIQRSNDKDIVFGYSCNTHKMNLSEKVLDKILSWSSSNEYVDDVEVIR